MAPSSLSSDEFSFPAFPSHDTHPSCLDSPQLWKRSPPESFRLEDSGGEEDDHRKSFSSYVEIQSRWSEDAEEKMDMLWQDLNDEPTRTRSLRIDSGSAHKNPSVSDDSSSSAAVHLGCGIGRSMKVSKKTATGRKKPNVFVFMRVLKKLLLLRNSTHRSPAKTHPR